LASLAIGCSVPDQAKFDRKNYFYPDLPKGYQISMYDQPIGVKGSLDIFIPAPKGQRESASIGITRLHLEEDAAKLTHGSSTSASTDDEVELRQNASYVDFNRAGTPLAEIVTEPDFVSPLEARIFLQELQRIMRALGVSDADMEKGQMRCDANVSLREVITDPEHEEQHARLNAKTEVKNINSIKNVERALTYEIKRQADVWEATGNPVSTTTTRGWDDAKGVTVEQRVKEAAQEYRYFPEPDIPPLDLKSLREKIAPTLPELPIAKRFRFIDEYGLSREDATTMTDDPALAEYVEEVFGELRAWLLSTGDAEGTEAELWEQSKKKLSRLVSGWLLSKLGGLLAEKNLGWAQVREKIDPENFGEFLALIHESKLGSAAAQTVLADMLRLGRDPSQIMEDRDLGQKSDPTELKPLVQSVIAHNPAQAAEYKAGKVNIIKFLVGVVMKETEGRANPMVAEELLKELLK
jgi:aspartyl-tRNA(Asn)/glutamyl-tRNA(Gln) amidotransferase subunit B